MILVVGATGIVGGMIVQQLLAQGKGVRVLLRHNSPSGALASQGRATPAQSLIDAGAQPVYGDLREPATLVEAVAGVDTVISTANSASRSGEDNIESVDRTGNQNLINAAREAGVKHFIYISALGADPASPVPFLQAKGNTEALLRESGMTYTIISPTPFIETWVSVIVGRPVMTGQPVTLVGEGKRRHSLVSNRDVAAFAVAAVDQPHAYNQTLAIGGPQALSWRDIVATFERVLGRSIPVQFLPPGTPLPGLSEVVSLLMAQMELYDSVHDTSELARSYGVKQVSVEDFIRSAFVPR